MKKIKIFLGITIILFSCQETALTPQEEQPFRILKASQADANLVNTWSNSNLNDQIVREFDMKDIYEIIDVKNDVSILAAFNIKEHRAVAFVKNQVGEIGTAFITSSLQDQKGNILSNVYTIDNNLSLSFTDYPNGERIITYSSKNSNARINGWWDTFDSCVGSFHNLFESNVANVVTIIVFDAVTLMGYSVGSLGFCAAVASLE
ncbi:MAG: hypothetical protein HC811_13140 [Flammeovirgaceae bacterium]|nr:hypothetical protein [Flammeovirgaceae bacterium]